jgi:hypothetical protein
MLPALMLLVLKIVGFIGAAETITWAGIGGFIFTDKTR